MLKFQNIAQVGDTIRAYDFRPMAGRGDAYVEGAVTAITNEPGYMSFKITVTADKFLGDVETVAHEDNRIGQDVFVPMETSFQEYDSRIINLSA